MVAKATDDDPGGLDEARWLLEQRVADPDVAAADLGVGPTLGLRRAGRVIAHVLVNGNRDEALAAARVAVGGFGADSVVMVMDMYRATEKWWTEINRKPGPGEFQRVFEAGRTDLVGESLFAVTVDRLGNAEGRSLPYELDRSTRTLTWGQDSVVEEPDGLVVRSLRASFDLGDPMLAMQDLGPSPEAYGLTDQEARVHADVAVTRLLLAMGHGVFLIPATLEDLTLVTSSFDGDESVSFYAKAGDSYQRQGPAFGGP